MYDFKRAIEDGATLPLRYLNRGEKLGIENPDLDERMAEIINDAELDDDQRRKLEREFKRDYPILTAESRLDAIAKDLVWHFNDRGYQGKAMFVALDKPTAVRMHSLVMKYWPEYVAELKQRIAHAEDQQEELELKQHLKRVEETEVCVVVSSEQNEIQKFANLGLDIEPHRKKMVDRDLETEFKDDNNPFRLVIVCAMWITGFDVPCLSTVYLDIRRLQQEVNFSVSTRTNEVREVDYVDLSTLDFDKLRAAFAKSNQKNAVVFDLQKAIEQKLEQMVQQNPIRLEFYEKYQKIIAEYNQGKDIQAVQKAFDDLNDFMQNDLSPETERAMREGLDEETLAIFDLLKKPELTKDEENKVKEVAKQTLLVLKAEKLKIEHWRESTQVTAQVKTLIDHSLQWLPQEPYPDEEVGIKSLLVYQHVYANYQGAGFSRYGCF